MKSNGKNAVVIILIALIMAASLVGGYKVITLLNSDVKEEFDSYTNPIAEKLYEEHEELAPFEYEGFTKREYDGPVIYQGGGYIFNSDGKVLEGYRNLKGEELRMTKNIYGSEAVLIDNHKCVYLDADLNAKVITDNCRFGGMCFEGGYVFYVVDAGVEDKVCIYDVKNDTEILMFQGPDISNVCISPDGQTIMYNFSTDSNKIYVKGIDGEEKICSVDEEAKVLVTVSNDRETIFFSDKNEYYCLNQGEVTELGEKDIYKDYLTRDCKQIVYIDTEGRIKYYRAGERKPVVLVNHKSYIKINGVAIQEQDIYMSDYIVDSDSFSDVMMIVDENKCYALKGKTPKVVNITRGSRSPYTFETLVAENGPTYMYEDDGMLYKVAYDGKDITSSVLFTGEDTGLDYACNEDHTKAWVRDGRKIYYVEEGAEPVLLTEIGSNSKFTTYDFRWDPFEDRFCYIVDGTLYSVGTTPDSIKEVLDDAKKFEIAVPGYSDGIGVTTRDGVAHLIIGDNVLDY